jgi:hypothetical protein
VKMRALALRLRREETGFAMVTAVILMAVLGTASAFIMAEGTHDNFGTGRGRSWVQALHVAESGVEQAISKLQSSSATYTGTFSGSVSEGSYAVTVTRLTRYRIRIDATGTVGTAQGLKARRKLRVTMAPPVSFKYALFSYTSVDTKNDDTINGDIWANQNVILAERDVINGSVTAATGYIDMKNQSRVTGDVWSGGYSQSTNQAIHLANGALVGGNAKASVTAPTDPITCGGESGSNYKVSLDTGSSISGTITTWGDKTGPGTSGPVTSNFCTAAPASEPLPQYTYSSFNYDGSTLHEFGTPAAPSATAVSDFQSYASGQGMRLSGTYVVYQSGNVSQATRIDLTGLVITGDTTIFTNVPIFSNNVSDDVSSDAILLLASTYQPPQSSSCDLNQDNSDCTIHLKNNFDPSGKTAALIYAPYGPVAVKNNQKQFGAIYASNILIKNNQEMTYDSRVERIVGFGIETYEIEQWLELNP